MAYRILIADDETDILEFVGYNLAKEGYEVFTACNGEQAVAAALEHRPHLILLDVMMPVKDGFQACAELRSMPETADMRIVFLSALGEEENQISGFGAGADDYIPKPIKMNLFKSRINAIMRRIGQETAESQDSTGGIEIDRNGYSLRLDGQTIALPRKEFLLFELLQSSPDRVFTREEIYERVWGPDVVVGDRTIDVHIRRLRRKVGDSRIVTVKGIGYKYQK